MGVGENRGTAACFACGGLLCVAHRYSRESTFGTIGEKAVPEPSPDVEWVQCAKCGVPIVGDPPEEDRL